MSNQSILDNDLLSQVSDINGLTLIAVKLPVLTLVNNVYAMALKSLPTAKQSDDRKKIEEAVNGSEVCRIASLVIKAHGYNMFDPDVAYCEYECGIMGLWHQLTDRLLTNDKVALSTIRKQISKAVSTFEEDNGLGQFTDKKIEAKKIATEKAREKNIEDADKLITNQFKKFRSDRIEWAEELGLDYEDAVALVDNNITQCLGDVLEVDADSDADSEAEAS